MVLILLSFFIFHSLVIFQIASIISKASSYKSRSCFPPQKSPSHIGQHSQMSQTFNRLGLSHFPIQLGKLSVTG